MTPRLTVAKSTQRFEGVGLHGGSPSWIQIHPSNRFGKGIIFRSHGTGLDVIASAENVVSTNRSTCLGSDEVRVDTVEHLLSALSGLGITDAIVEYDGAELPIGDGSALPFVELLAEAGSESNGSNIDELTLDHEISVSDGRGAVITAVPSDSFWIVGVIEYSAYPAIGTQAAFYSGAGYRDTIAPARTYGFHHELTALRAAGLGLGASLQNVVALMEDGVADERTPFRMPDELVRHKILDLIGDLSLSQKQIKAGIVALRPSHTLNVKLSRLLLGSEA